MSNAQKPRPAKTAKADAADAVTPAAEPQLFTADIAATIHEQTTRFELKHTGPGLYAEVRAFDITNPDLLSFVPKHLLAFAMRSATAADAARDLTLGPDGEPDPDKLFDMLENEANLARQICLHGFVRPRLTENADEVGGDVVHVNSVHPQDRRAFMYYSLNPVSEEASKLTTFPEQSA